MSITPGVLAQSPEPEAHDKVFDNNPDRIGIWKCWSYHRQRLSLYRISSSDSSGGFGTFPIFNLSSLTNWSCFYYNLLQIQPSVT